VGAENRALLKSLEGADPGRCEGAASFLQSGFWGGFKARFGWTPRPFLARWAKGAETSILALSRRLGPFFSFAYVPWGPELPPGFPPEDRNQALGELARALRPLLPGDTAFIRFDPPWHSEGAASPAPSLGKPFSRAAADIQCPDTVLLDLAPPEGAILGAMKPKWRYNIRLAEKRGVRVRQARAEELAVFYGLLGETARRDGIAIHQLDYYQTLFSHAEGFGAGAPEIRLYLAEHEGDTLAGIVTLFRGTEAVYLYGASGGIKRGLMAPYALQWRALTDAKASGCLTYDLFGIPPSDDPGHPMAGLYLFKTGFGGRIIHRPGSWDFPCRPLASGLFRAAEALRKRLRDRKKRRG
jgi:lipid II:glycine glycyltransferase (peptidoglycan interpeptide bridge formation enzyme)